MKSAFVINEVRLVIRISGAAEIKAAMPAMFKMPNDPNQDVQSEAYRWIAYIGADNPAVLETVVCPSS